MAKRKARKTSTAYLRQQIAALTKANNRLKGRLCESLEQIVELQDAELSIQRESAKLHDKVSEYRDRADALASELREQDARMAQLAEEVHRLLAEQAAASNTLIPSCPSFPSVQNHSA